MSMTALIPATSEIMPRRRQRCWSISCRTPAGGRGTVRERCRDSSGILSRQMNGRADARIGAATADIAAHGVVDVGIAGLRCLLEQCACRHQLPALAIAALNDVDFGPRPAQCVDLRAADALDGHDLAPLHGLDGRYAGTHRFAVQVHGAGAAQRLAATIL